VCCTFEDPAAVDKTIGVLQQVEEVKGIMHDSINEMLATRDNLEVLEDKTESLRTEAATFQRQAVTLKRSMWWRNMKLKLLCGVIVVVVLAYVLLPQLTALPGLQGAASASSSSSASSSDEPSSEEGAASSSSALSRR